ncbi:DEAD/DEAH box helicase [Actinokineospora enzanensis]|uniref:DEAD/DEAH box helicase n=1 Tax=Actinokineospora enzanensis TaxID=155975 RepID=UPI00036BA2DD|nr:DEAD/DEAH box helicase [Actinokineospora enzanensis]
MTCTFHGLFIGIDTYRDAAFPQLKFAARDARVLHALFSDNVDGNCVLVEDAAATRARITAELRAIAAVSDDDDIVVITYSGHGTRSRELATHDAVRGRFAETALPLADLVELVNAIRGRMVVGILDCCFSGGLLARAFFEPDDGAGARSDGSDAWDALKAVSGAGRVFLGAASADEEAFEQARYRHGILTHHLVQGLMGAGAVLREGRVSLAALVDYVLDRVADERIGYDARRQHPTFVGAMCRIQFPPLVPGARYAALGGPIEPPPVNKDVLSLVPYGVPGSVAELWRDRIGKLNDVQVAAINRGGVLRGCAALVVAPTAAGKTKIGEIVALHAAAQDRKTVFLLPSRALVNEKYEQFTADYAELGLKVIRVTGELRDQIGDLLSGEYRVAVLTYEAFLGLLTRRPSMIERVGVLVVDEIQSLLLPDRGPRLELLFTRLRRGVGMGAPMPQLVGLSAVLGDPEELASWLGAEPVSIPDRVIPLSEGVLSPDGIYRHRTHGGRQESAVDDERQLLTTSGLTTGDDLVERLVENLVAEGRQVIVFRSRRAGTRTFAQRLAGRLGLAAAATVLEDLPGEDVSRVGQVLRACLGRGVAFHNADLRDDERKAVERGFRGQAREIRVVVATTTLAQGVNLPADTVVLCELEHPGRQGRPYSVSEYKNMAGRAGRNAQGVGPAQAIVMSAGGLDAERIWRDYVCADVDLTRSALLARDLDLHTLVLAVLQGLSGAAECTDAAAVIGFLAWSFGAFQARNTGEKDPFPAETVRKVIEQLRAWDFLAGAEAGYRLTEIGRIVVHSGLCIESARTLVATLRAVQPGELTSMTLLCVAQLVTEVGDGRFARRAANWQREYDEFARTLAKHRVASSVITTLLGPRSQDGHQAGRVRQAIACRMWSTGQPIAKIEVAVTLHLAPQDGIREAGPIEQAARHTADVIGTVIAIARILHPDADLGDLAEALPVQLAFGITKGLVPIVRHLDRPVDRAVYLRLIRAAFDTPAAVAAAESARLRTCAGDEATAAALLAAAEAALVEADQPTLDDLLDPPED